MSVMSVSSACSHESDPSQLSELSELSKVQWQRGMVQNCLNLFKDQWGQQQPLPGCLDSIMRTAYSRESGISELSELSELSDLSKVQ